MLKAIAKRVVSKDHWQFLSWYRDRFGFLHAIRAYIDLISGDGICRVPDKMTGDFVFLRPGTSDQTVYDEVFILKSYDINLGDPLFIVDAGAHIGLSSVYFARKYPKAIIVAIEPEPHNFDILLMNTRDYDNVRPIQAGLWSRKTHLRIEDSDVPTWSFRVSECTSDEGIPAIGIRDIMSEFNTTQIDILKMDIEGSELEVLSHYNSWIDNVKTIIIELHDRFQPGCTDALEKAISGFNYSKSTSGENIVIANLSRIPTT